MQQLIISLVIGGLIGYALFKPLRKRMIEDRMAAMEDCEIPKDEVESEDNK